MTVVFVPILDPDAQRHGAVEGVDQISATKPVLYTTQMCCPPNIKAGFITDSAAFTLRNGDDILAAKIASNNSKLKGMPFLDTIFQHLQCADVHCDISSVSPAMLSPIIMRFGVSYWRSGVGHRTVRRSDGFVFRQSTGNFTYRTDMGMS